MITRDDAKKLTSRTSIAAIWATALFGGGVSLDAKREDPLDAKREDPLDAKREDPLDGVDLAKEYRLVQEKKSRLSARKRALVVKRYESGEKK